MHPSSGSRDPAPSNAYRQLILALIVLGAVGLFAELLLLEHFDSRWQWAPLVALAGTVLTAILVALRPTPGSLRAFRFVMTLCVAFGVVGVFLHLKGNLEFELEGAPDLRGWPLYWASIRGATPALAPGALAQLGLLGLLFAYRHPAGSPTITTRPSTSQESP